MKLTGAKANRFATKPDADVLAVLVYGPDRGLVRERVEALIAAWGVDAADPFGLASLSEDALKADPAKLEDEARALSLTGATRGVRVSVGGDAAGGAIAGYVEALDADAFQPAAKVVVDAGALTPRSKIRKAFEGAKRAAALPCYADSPDTIADLIDEAAAAGGFALTQAARALAIPRLEGDRALARAELEKLALYAHGRSEPVDVDDVDALIAGAEPGDVNAVADATLDGDPPGADAAYQRALAAGAGPVGVVLALQRNLLRLDAIRAAVDGGGSADQALNAVRPPVFGPARGRVKSQLRAWSRTKLDRALRACIAAERAVKTAGAADAAICGRLVLSLARSARR